MIGDEGRLEEVIDEISEWPLARRRRYIAEMESAFGKAASEQIKAALQAAWDQRKA
jgi:hypothetical protein